MPSRCGPHLVSLNLTGELSYLDSANPTQGRSKQVIAHTGPANCLALLPSGELASSVNFVSGGDDGRVLTWRDGVATQVEGLDPATRRTHSGKAIGVAGGFPNGVVVSVGYDDKLKVSGANGVGVARELNLGSQPVELAAAPGADLVVVALANGKALFLRLSVFMGAPAPSADADTGAVFFQVALPGSPLALAVSSDGTECACSVESVIHVLAVPADGSAAAALTVISKLEGHRGLVGCLAYSPDQQWLAAGDANREIKVRCGGDDFFINTTGKMTTTRGNESREAPIPSASFVLVFRAKKKLFFLNSLFLLSVYSTCICVIRCGRAARGRRK